MKNNYESKPLLIKKWISYEKAQSLFDGKRINNDFRSRTGFIIFLSSKFFRENIC